MYVQNEQPTKEKGNSMKLYYSPAAGSLASHITVRELGLDVELVRVGLPPMGEHKTETGEDYFQIQPRGYVPFLKIDGGTDLSEGSAILQYLADQKPEAGMSPREGTPERYELQSWLTFVGTELQRILTSFFVPDHLSEAGLAFANARLHQRLEILDAHLAGQEFLVGATYTVADAYAFAILNWIPAFKLDIDLGKYENVSSYLDRIRSREAVQVAMKEEGLLD